MEEEQELIKHPKSKEEFEEIIKGNKPVLVDFFAVWCGPCQLMGPILDQMAKTYENIDKVEIVKVDIDELREVALDHGVMSVPTFILFKDGKPVETMVGVRSQGEIESKLNDLIK
jgi:thioredoxin 1